MNSLSITKKSSSILLLLSIACCLIVITGCNKNDSSTEITTDESPIGNWFIIKITTERNGETEILTQTEILDKGIIWTIELNADSAMQMTENYRALLNSYSGNWYIEDQQIRLITVIDGIVRLFIYKGTIKLNKLVLEWEESSGKKCSAEFSKH